MKSKDPLFPYQNLFITSRPGMGATTLAINIINKYLDEGKKCLVFEKNTNCCRTEYIKRTKVIRENIGMDNAYPRISIEKYGNLTVAYDYHFELDTVLSAISEHNADVIIYEDPNILKDQSKELIRVAMELKKMGKLFIFVTHLKRKTYPFTHMEKHDPSVSRHSKAISHFDATAIVYRNGYYDGKADTIGEIRIYERGKKKYRAIPLKFDFQHQRVEQI